MSNGSIVPMESDTTFSFTIDETKPVRFSITNNDGDVSIQAVDGKEITVVATPTRSRGPNTTGRPEDDFFVEAENNRISIRPNWQIGNTVTDIAQKVKTQLKDGFRSEDWDFKKMRFAGDASYDLDVRIPRVLAEGSTIAAKTTSGDVHAVGLRANVSIATASGDVEMEKIEGKVSAHSASGDVSMRMVTGSLESNTASGDIQVEGGDAWTALRSVSGDIRIRDFTMKSARVTTVSGTVNVDATLNNAADYSFDSVSGDMELTTRVPSSGATLTYRSLSGETHVGGDWTKGSGKRTWTIGGAEGGPKISVKTVSGELHANGIVSGDLEARSEAMPKDVREETEEQVTKDESRDQVSDSTTVVVDADWDRAKGWLKDITQRVSKFVEELDSAGERRLEERKGTSNASTEPIDVTPSAAETNAAAETSAPTEPLAAPPASSPTEPLDPVPPVPPTAPATPPVPPTPPAAPEPEVETTAQRRLRLLEAVQRGELTVDEALAQLDDQKS